MANIQTRKNMVVTQQGPAMGVTPTPQGLIVALANEGVEHCALMTIQEATDFGVNIIRLAQQSEFMARAEQASAVMQMPGGKVPNLGIVGANGKVSLK